MNNFNAAYAAVWDTIYGEPVFVAAQISFVEQTLAETRGPWLDAGCGTGRHLLPLRTAGHEVVGLDLSEAMLAVAQARLTQAGLWASLVRGDVRTLPFGQAFGGVLCLDSLLPLLLSDEDLTATLAGIRRGLRLGGLLIAEIYDYPGTLGEEPLGPHISRFPAAWGRVIVREKHRYEQAAGFWYMTQELTVLRGGRPKQFTLEHCLRIRSADVYAAALEEAGFTILQLFPFYPGSPPYTRNELRMIFVARSSGS
jgi:SAM-dependent methyltransferase